MGRSKRNRNKNKFKNRSSNSQISGAETLKFIKQIGDWGLFCDIDGTKFRVHKSNVYGTLPWLLKGSMVAVKIKGICDNPTKRMVVMNTPEWFGSPSDNQTSLPFDDDFDKTVDTIDWDELAKQASAREKKTYKYQDEVRVIKSSFDSIRLGVPIGTQYHWLTFEEVPEVGDYVIATRVGKGASVRGFVTSVDANGKTCSVNGFNLAVNEIGYKVTNPFFIKQAEAANV